MRNNIQYQAGFLIPVALFILVVMGGLSIAIVRMGTVNQIAPMQEHLSIQAYYAARTGAEYALHNIYFLPPPKDGEDPPNAINYSHVQSVCKKLKESVTKVDKNKKPIPTVAIPANHCYATVRCEWNCVAANTTNRSAQALELTIISQGVCGRKQELWGDRTLEVRSLFDDSQSGENPDCTKS